MSLAFPTFLLSAALAAVLSITTLPAQANDGLAASQAIDTGPFRRVEVSGEAEIVLVQGDREAVEVEGSTRRRTLIRVRNEGDTLRLTADEDTGFRSLFSLGSAGHPVRITVHFRTLDTLALSGRVKASAAAVKVPALAVKASGAANVQIDALDTGSFRFAGSGAVKGEVSGRATQQEVSISGAGQFRAAGLNTERAVVRVSGAGRVVVHATRALDAQISGAGTIDYLGSPEVRQRVSGAGRIRQIPGAAAIAPGVNAPGMPRAASPA